MIRADRERGAALIEFAVILPVLLVVALGIFDVGLAMFNKLRLTFTAQAVAVAEANQTGSGQAWGEHELQGAKL